MADYIEYCKSQGHKARLDEFTAFMKQMDTNNDKLISKDEFLEFWTKLLLKQFIEEQNRQKEEELLAKGADLNLSRATSLDQTKLLE